MSAPDAAPLGQPAPELSAEENALLAAFAQAAESLTAMNAELTRTVDELTARPLLSDDERKALEEQAASGSLGPEMKEAAAAVQAGEDSWEALFAGESPRSALLTAHLGKVLEDNLEDIQLAFEDLLDAEEAKGNFPLDEVPGQQPAQ